MPANISGNATGSTDIDPHDLIEIGRACGAATCDDVAFLVGREQTGTISEEERDELQRLRRLEVI